MEVNAYSEAWDGTAGLMATAFVLVIVILILAAWGLAHLIRRMWDLSRVGHRSALEPPTPMVCVRCGASGDQVDRRLWRCGVCGEKTYLTDAGSTPLGADHRLPTTVEAAMTVWGRVAS